MNQKQLWVIHQWVGLYAGIAIAFLSLTGATALFRIELDQLLNPGLYRVQAGAMHLPLSPAVEKVLAMHPDKHLFEVELPYGPEGTWNIRLQPQKNNDLFPVFWEVFVDPYRGTILGERNYYRSFTYYLRNLHVRFYEGWYGRQIVGLAGLALLISTLTGILIYGQFMKRQLFASIRKNRLRATMADLHKLIGVATLAFNLMIAITGTWLGLQTYLQNALSIERPNNYVRPEKPLNDDEDALFLLDFASISRQCQTQFPTLIPRLVRPSANGECTVSVIGDVPRQVYERNSNKIVLDKADHEMLYVYNISQASLGVKAFFVQEALHFGDFGGIGLKILYCLLALTSGFLSVSGFVIYLERTCSKRETKPTFIELKPLLLRWTAAILGFCVLMGMLSLTWGIGIPTLLVTTTFYGATLFLLIRAVFRFFQRKRLSRQAT